MSKIGILTVVASENEMPKAYLGEIKSCNGSLIVLKGLELNEIAKLNNGSLKTEQLKTLAGGTKLHKDFTIDVDGKTFMFKPLFVSKQDELKVNYD